MPVSVQGRERGRRNSAPPPPEMLDTYRLAERGLAGRGSRQTGPAIHRGTGIRWTGASASIRAGASMHGPHLVRRKTSQSFTVELQTERRVLFHDVRSFQKCESVTRGLARADRGATVMRDRRRAAAADIHRDVAVTSGRVVSTPRLVHAGGGERAQGLTMELQTQRRILPHDVGSFPNCKPGRNRPVDFVSLAGRSRPRALRATVRGAALCHATAGDIDTGACAQSPAALSRLDLPTGESAQGFTMELQTQRRILSHGIHSFFKISGANPPRESHPRGKLQVDAQSGWGRGHRKRKGQRHGAAPAPRIGRGRRI